MGLTTIMSGSNTILINTLDSAIKPPKWYSKTEIMSALGRMNYSAFIQEELSDWIVLHFQYAFNKGFQKGQQAQYESPCANGTELHSTMQVVADETKAEENTASTDILVSCAKIAGFNVDKDGEIYLEDGVGYRIYISEKALAKFADDCATSMIHSAREIAAYQRLDGNGKWLDVDVNDIPHYQAKGQQIRPLFAAPQSGHLEY